MKSKKLNIYLVEDLLNDLLQLDVLIAMHHSGESIFMAEQYEARKLRVFNKLIGHLVDSGADRHDPKILFYVNQLIERFFPEARQQPLQAEYAPLNALLIAPLTASYRTMVQEQDVKYGK